MTRGTPTIADRKVVKQALAEFDAPLKIDEAKGGPVLPSSVQAAVKPILEMLAVVQARLRKIEKLIDQSRQPAEICDVCNDEQAVYFYCAVCIEAATSED